MFIRTENFQTFIRLYPIVTFILALQAVLWLFFSLPVHSVVLWRDAVTGYNLGVANGEWWRLITPVLLHAGFTHLLFNSMSIFLFAPALERMLGKARFLLVYAGSGIIGNIGTYVTEPLDYVHVGASGAISGCRRVPVYGSISQRADRARAFQNDSHTARICRSHVVYQLQY